jgi:sucrose-6-phosphate hydrolase SacC (GH32 family)
MNNWVYARQIPTSTWRGAMTLPRVLSLVRTPDGIRLRQQPVTNLRNLRRSALRQENVAIPAGGSFTPPLETGSLWEIRAEFAVAEGAGEFGVRLAWESDAAVTIGYRSGGIFCDRTVSGRVEFNPAFPAIHSAPLALNNGRLRLHVFVDHSSVEIFANDGLVCMTERIFPAEGATRITFFAAGAPVTLTQLEIYPLSPASTNTIT